ncbi:MAG TPA: HRDC domain-containing protein [Acidimicrobiales bacterium]|nr:HRDC domain-containing protein [Acidimicrobiales bacterium]
MSTRRAPAITPEWVDDAGRFLEVLGEVAAAPAYAIDTEFHRERTYYAHLALLQMAWPGGLALVDPLALDIRPLADVLEGEGTAVLHAADQDLEVLLRACGVLPRRLFDTQVAAGFLGFSTPSLQTLVENIVGLGLPKGDRLTDWTKRPLTDEQQTYAAADVAYLPELHATLCDRLKDRGRLEWAAAECEELRLQARSAQDPATAWWRLKSSRSLRGSSRGVAQEVAAWREQRAAEIDLPPRFVLADLALASIAQRPPRTREELLGVRGLDGRNLKGGVASEVMAAVSRGRELPEAELRRPPSEEQLERTLRPAVTLVSAWVGQLAADLEIDTALLANRADLQAYLRHDPAARLATGWRHELVGQPVGRLVEGKAALAFDGDSLVLEDRPL